MPNLKESLEEIYNKLFKAFGPQNWWPAETTFEVIVGAILTQNTAWVNVEKAINHLKKEKVLTPLALKKVPLKRLALLIKPSGYYNQKAKKLKNFIDFLYKEYQGSLSKMFREETFTLRKKLLKIKGIGPETADSILLYAGNKPIFVIDAYTRRVLLHHHLIEGKLDYSSLQKIFMQNLEHHPQLFNEYHALLVRLGKEFCRATPKCKDCPLEGLN